jgi:hypothetical protein
MKMKDRLLKPALLLLSVSFYLSGISQRVTIVADPANGSPGDIINIKVSGVRVSKNAEVTIGKERALVFSSSDSAIAVMVPPMSQQNTMVTVRLDNQKAETPFLINGPSTVRLWFSMKDNKVSFISSQASNEDFVQDKSHSEDKMMYEVFDKAGNSIAVGYINNPLVFEIPAPDGKEFSKTELKEEVKFSINVPAFPDMGTIQLSTINANTKYKPARLGMGLGISAR